MATDFMAKLKSRLMTEKEITESTASAYLRSLVSLNSKIPIKSLVFLKDTPEILKRVSEYAKSTQRTLLATVVSVLGIAGVSYKKARKIYQEHMMTLLNEHRKEPKGVKTETQAENWMSWDEVLAKQEGIKKQVSSFSKKRSLSEQEWTTLLDYMVLSLYTLTPPRRNADYQFMSALKAKETPADCSRNWLCLQGTAPNQFVFNIYKTAKKYGQQCEAIPDTLREVIALYLKHHPKREDLKKPSGIVPLLVTFDGLPVKSGNVITRILNRVLGKRVGASMLRHSYLTSKYGEADAEREEDSRAMAHSVGQQRDYILKDDESDSE